MTLHDGFRRWRIHWLLCMRQYIPKVTIEAHSDGQRGQQLLQLQNGHPPQQMPGRGPVWMVRRLYAANWQGKLAVPRAKLIHDPMLLILSVCCTTM